MLCVPFGEKLFNVFFLKLGEAPKGKFIYGCTKEACKPSVEDPEEGEGPALLIFEPNWGLKGWKKLFLRPPPPLLSEDLDPPPLTLTLFKTKSVHYPV